MVGLTLTNKLVNLTVSKTSSMCEMYELQFQRLPEEVKLTENISFRIERLKMRLHHKVLLSKRYLLNSIQILKKYKILTL